MISSVALRQMELQIPKNHAAKFLLPSVANDPHVVHGNSAERSCFLVKHISY